MGIDYFAVLDQKVSIHLNPRGGTLFVDGAPSEIGEDEISFLEKCNGVTKVKDALPYHWKSKWGDLEFLTFISELKSAGLISLRKTPERLSVKITGSRTLNIPPHMSIELTANCNLKCRHCYRNAGQIKNDFMPADKLIDILFGLAESGLRSVELTGGEPLMHPNIQEILQACSDRFHMTGLLTNGTIMPDSIFNQLLRMRNKVLVSISLDGSTPERHESRRGVIGSYSRTIATIQKLSSKGIQVRVSMAVDEESFSDIEATLLVARNAGAFAFSYTPVLPLGRGREWAGPGWKLDGQKVMQAEEKLARKYAGFLSVIPADKQEQLSRGKNCGAGYRTYTMDPSGNVRPCGVFHEGAIIIGNLVNQKIEDVFAHPVTNAFADFPFPTPATCAGCEHELFCKYCGMRGFQASEKLGGCRWTQHPKVQKIKEYLE